MVGVIITAGGSGSRMNKASVPKQFLNLNGKPVIAHAINIYQRSNMIDYIIVACKDGWIDFLYDIISEFKFSKVVDVVIGGSTNQLSIYNALLALKKTHKKNGVVIVSDGVRPFITENDIESCVLQVLESGCSIAVNKCIETIVYHSERDSCNDVLDRNFCKIVKAPQGFLMSDIILMHEKSLADNIKNFPDSASMFHHYGMNLNYFECSVDNIKITTAKDFFLAESIMKTKFELEVLGVSSDFK